MKVRHLILILGDQLSDAMVSLRDADPQRDRILMAEVQEEGRYVAHHPQKILFILSAMRHFAEQLRADGFTVDYIQLDDADNSGSLQGELARARARHQPERMVLCKPGEWRLLSIFQKAQQDWPELELRDDDRFFCSQARFEAWAKGRKQLRMELFYREMRKHTQLLMDPDGGPAGAPGTMTRITARPCQRRCKSPNNRILPRTASRLRCTRWWPSSLPTITVRWRALTIR